MWKAWHHKPHGPVPLSPMMKPHYTPKKAKEKMMEDNGISPRREAIVLKVKQIKAGDTCRFERFRQLAQVIIESF